MSKLSDHETVRYCASRIHGSVEYLPRYLPYCMPLRVGHITDRLILHSAELPRPRPLRSSMLAGPCSPQPRNPALPHPRTPVRTDCAGGGVYSELLFTSITDGHHQQGRCILVINIYQHHQRTSPTGPPISFDFILVLQGQGLLMIAMGGYTKLQRWIHLPSPNPSSHLTALPGFRGLKYATHEIHIHRAQRGHIPTYSATDLHVVYKTPRGKTARSVMIRWGGVHISGTDEGSGGGGIWKGD